MAITQVLQQSNVNYGAAYGTYTDTAASPAAAVFTIGFLPRKVRWVNATDRIQYEWVYGNANGTTLKTAAAGTGTLDTVDVAITVDSVNTGGGASAADNYPPRVKADFLVTIGAAAILQNKVYYFEFEA